ncbi:MAG: zf-HC2 domain-containing protein, partial [Solirubrobacteraceae bacterium]
MTDPHDRFAEDCAAYVLGALHEDEAASLRDHLLECASCREEVARLRSVADALGRAVPPLVAPPDLRRRVLGAVASEAAITT